MSLPVAYAGGDLLVVDPDTGEGLPVEQASDHALAHAASKVAEFDKDLLQVKRALAAELRDRHGVGKTHAGGFAFTVAESQSWPANAVLMALEALVADGRISAADRDRACPHKPKPDARALKALLGRLLVSDPDAARTLSDACTVSPASVRDVTPTSLEAT